jgi:hypothetical protein
MIIKLDEIRMESTGQISIILLETAIPELTGNGD